MAQSRVQWVGLDDFQKALRNLPDALASQAVRIGEQNANASAFDIRSAYGAHWVTGRLQASVVVIEQQRAFGFRFQVRAKAKHAHLLEFGTKARHYFTKRGVKHVLGALPPRPVFIPRVRKWRRRMYDDLKAMMMREGLLVTGDA